MIAFSFAEGENEKGAKRLLRVGSLNEQRRLRLLAGNYSASAVTGRQATSRLAPGSNCLVIWLSVLGLQVVVENERPDCLQGRLDPSLQGRIGRVVDDVRGIDHAAGDRDPRKLDVQAVAVDVGDADAVLFVDEGLDRLAAVGGHDQRSGDEGRARGGDRDRARRGVDRRKRDRLAGHGAAGGRRPHQRERAAAADATDDFRRHGRGHREVVATVVNAADVSPNTLAP